MKNKKTNPRRKFILSVVAGVAAVTCPFSVFAGAWTGGSTEITQMANKLELVLQYALQVEQFIIQGKQLQAELTNLLENPASLLGSEVGGMINKIGTIMNVGNSIGWNIAQIDKNFGKMFKNQTALSLSDNFTNWHKTSTDTLEAALKSAGLQNQRYEDETAKIQALYDKSQDSAGNLAALQMLAEINSHQMKQMQSLGQLISTQNIATSTYMAAQMARDQAKQKAGEINFKATTPRDNSSYKNPTF